MKFTGFGRGVALSVTRTDPNDKHDSNSVYAVRYVEQGDSCYADERPASRAFQLGTTWQGYDTWQFIDACMALAVISSPVARHGCIDALITTGPPLPNRDRAQWLLRAELPGAAFVDGPVVAQLSWRDDLSILYRIGGTEFEYSIPVGWMDRHTFDAMQAMVALWYVKPELAGDESASPCPNKENEADNKEED